ncbi:MAG: DoxX family protein [Gemmataceae bacterium]|nr:DoxX family protein [Gemmataceae bacterium]
MNPVVVPLVLLGVVVLCVAVAARAANKGGETELKAWSRFFLVGLRLVIGWHFLVEGLDKLHSPNWSSEGYLREASGPLAPQFRALAGDRLADKLTVPADGSFPAELALEWSTYLAAFNDYYGLDEEARAKARALFDQAKSRTLTWLTNKQPVVVSAAQPPDYRDELTMAERLERQRKLEAAVAAIEADLPAYGQELFPKHQSAKADLNRWRGAMKRDLDQHFLALKKDLRDGVLVPMLLETAPEKHRTRLAPPKKDPDKKETDKDKKEADRAKKEREWLFNVQGVYLQILLEQTSNKELTLDPLAEKILVSAFLKPPEPGGDNMLPFTPRRPISAWTMLDYADAIVKYGLVAVGACLLAGFLTRTACLAGALFLLMFFVAMPPLPWWPESPRAEGHYLYINKNIIEMFALLALATLRTGRWVGVDGLLRFLRPARWRTEPASGNVNT